METSQDELIESLRALTGATRAACASALEEASGHFETAVELLRSTQTAEKEAAFERLEGRAVAVEDLDGKTVDLLMQGRRFEDGDFCVNDWRILYKSEDQKWQWMCEGCHAKNALPAELQTPQGMQRALTVPWQISCTNCAKEVPVQAYLVQRVWGFARPEKVVDEVTRRPVGKLDVWRLFRGNPEASDVHQGMVGNCWFMAAVAVVAERRGDLLTQLFWNSDISEVGLYAVRLFVNGEWRWTLVDDLLPVNAIGQLVYSSSLRFQLWLPLLEKAAAKVAGSYEALHGGSFGEAFALLTGEPTEEVFLPEEDDLELLWSRLVSWDEAGYLLGACCVERKDLALTELNDLGLQAPHGYTVMKTLEYEGERLLHLRNPIGDRSMRVWQGPWSFSSLSGETKRALKITNVNGDFLLHPKADMFMPFSTFVKYFTLLEICRCDASQKPRKVSSHGAWLRQTGASFTGFRVRHLGQASTTCDISMYQEVGKFRKLAANLDLGFAVLSEAPAGDAAAEEPACTKVRHRGEASQELLLAAGASLLVVPLSFSASEASENRRVTLTVHGSDDAELLISSLRLTGVELARGIYAFLDKHGKIASIGNVPGVTLRTAVVPGVGVVFGVENASSPFPITVTIDALDSVNVDSSRGSLLTEDTVSIGHKVVLQILRFTSKASDTKLAYSVGMRLALTVGDHFFPPVLDNEPYHAVLPLHDPTVTLLKHYLSEGLSEAEAASVVLQELAVINE